MKRNTHILPHGSKVIAKKDQFMDSDCITPNAQFLTKNKEYTIIGSPMYYDTPIKIMDDQNMLHHCPTSYFK